MNIVNRAIMIVASLSVFLFGMIIFVLLTGIVVPGNQTLRNILALYSALRAVALLRGASGNTAILIALMLAAIGLAVLVLELWGPVRLLFIGRQDKRYVIRRDTHGQVTIGRSMVRDVVQHEAEAVPGVLHAEPSVQDGKDGLRVYTRASLVWDADTPGTGQILQERIRESVQNHLGLPVAEVNVVAQTAPLPKEPPRRRVA
jgi:uncharacterized alkaline shock family protein YloU